MSVNRNSWKLGQLMQRMGAGAIAALSVTFSTATPAHAAEEIRVFYGLLGISLQIDSLERYAETGEIDRQLGFYLSRVDEEKQGLFRLALTETRDDLDPLPLYRFFNTPTGEALLTQVGTLVNIPGGINGIHALRAAIVGAALSDEGLTLLNALRRFPTDIEIDAKGLFKAADRVELLAKGTEFAVNVMRDLSQAEAAAGPSVDFDTLPDIRQDGDRGVVADKVVLRDESRDREFYVLTYRPQRWRNGETPVVVMSHGLASNPESFDRHARFLASHGYFVAVPQHPGSDSIQAQALLGGYSRVVYELNEFIDRPADVSFVLDELERRNASEFGGRLNLERVAAFGHSFGGYTVLALGGATINFDQLDIDCGPSFGPNVSLLLQCRALDLPREEYDFRDPRIAAVAALNPVMGVILGRTGLEKVQTPVVIFSGSYDPATPAALEQISTFSFFPETVPSYLGLIEGQAHVDLSEVDAGVAEAIEAAPFVTLPSPDLLDNYTHSMSLAFLEVHLLDNQGFLSYLSSAYATYISQSPKKLLWISDASAAALDEATVHFQEEFGTIQNEQ
ncbi:putative dienelactone hydrolase [Rubidibacter lacunae KORDI 51-2]|uniref:Putative dienelactone hydrolase n=1 Tax=Rubidibacter lacunae KORDI 51-2 TaxID=582515 RepID=U5DIP5_9CHRO|nr:alpha/beta hydrolase [Rubidibacter lacunae]ERN40464.1 putative dienelactone hydrolase [Rubidibacter lacunae KORDI 51-2]